MGTSVGRISMWIDLVKKKNLKTYPIVPIFPPPRFTFELRVIVWSCKAFVFTDEAEKCNDIFVRIGPGN